MDVWSSGCWFLSFLFLLKCNGETAFRWPYCRSEGWCNFSAEVVLNKAQMSPVWVKHWSLGALTGDRE